MLIYRFLGDAIQSTSYCILFQTGQQTRFLLCLAVPANPTQLLQHVYPSLKAGFYFVGLGCLRAPLVTLFHDTVNFCFNSALEGMGTTVRDVIYDHLEQKHIPRPEISTRFDDVVQVLMETFGTSARIIIYKTLSELYGEYSLRADFTYQDSLRDRFILLKDRVVADHLMPRRAQRGDWPPENMSVTPSIVQNPSSPIARTRA